MIETVLNKRDATTNEISLLLDGGESKSSPVITVFTTNHIDKINPVFLRGKRIGSIVTLEHPDKETALEILENSLEDITGKKLYRGSLEKSAQLIETNKIVPAFVAEIVERVKTHLTFSGNSYCTDEDIVLAINSYKAQIELSTYKDNEKTDADVLSESLAKLVEKASKVNAVEATINDISNEVDRIGENF